MRRSKTARSNVDSNSGTKGNLSRLGAALLSLVRQYASELDDPSLLGPSEARDDFCVSADCGGYCYSLRRSLISDNEEIRRDSLTPRERDVEVLVVQGLTGPQIATALGITLNTLGVHMRRVYGKRDVHTRGQLMLKRRAKASKSSGTPGS